MECLKELREWLTALGTVGAVIVALWLGLTANRRTKRQDRRRSLMYAAGMVSQLAQTRDVISSCAAMCVFGARPAQTGELHDHRGFGRAVHNVQRLLSKPRFEPGMEALVGMAALPNNCASRIASAFDQIKRIEAEVLGYDVIENAIILGTGSNLPVLLDSWGHGFSRAVGLLNVAIAECAKAADIAAPEPSVEELGGGDHDD